METHERFVIRIKHWALDGHAINRIRPVEYNDLYARFFAGAHTEIHRPDECIIARPDILEINEQDIEIFQHFCDWLAVFAVQTVNGNVKTRMLVTFPFHHVILRLAEKPMLRAKKRCETKMIAMVSLENARCMLEHR